MRREVLLVAAFLLIGAAVLTFWPNGRSVMEPSPPGQYPLHESRFEWPMTERKKAYRPTASMGEETIKMRDSRDAKARCGIDNTCPASLSF
jgi:hypothetical protein